MAKKWICTVCGYVHEGDTPPEKCPQCKQPAEKFKELKEDEEVTYAAEHVIGVAKGVDPEILAGLKARNPRWTEGTLRGRMLRGGHVSGYVTSSRP